MKTNQFRREIASQNSKEGKVAASQNSRQKERKQRAKRKKKLERQQESGGSCLVVRRKITSVLGDKLASIYEMMESGDLAKADSHLQPIVKTYGNTVEVLQLDCLLRLELEDYHAVAEAARQWQRLRPSDPHAKLMYAQGMQMQGLPGAAVLAYREIIEKHADSQVAQPAAEALESCEAVAKTCLEEVRKIESIDVDFENGGLDILAKHQLVLHFLIEGDHAAAIPIGRELVDVAPKFISARNNLASCLHQLGQVTHALQVTRETMDIAPNNKFTEALLGRLLFLSGEMKEAEAVGDRIDEPAVRVDAYIAQLEFLSFLGRDDQVLELAKGEPDQLATTPIDHGLAQHYEAVARYRLGQRASAMALWQKSTENLPNNSEPHGNLKDIAEEAGHAAWAANASKWLPAGVIDALRHGRSVKKQLKESPWLRKLVPAMLDRGDIACRVIALACCESDRSPDLVQARKDFAFSNRGPVGMRMEVLGKLVQENRIDGGPHRFFGRNGWQDVLLSSATISDEPLENGEPWQTEQSEQVANALLDKEFDLAESLAEEILERNPDCISAQYNQALAWSMRDGQSGKRRAADRIRKINKEHPDYLFAACFVATEMANKGNFERAHELLRVGLSRDVLHYTEAKALYTAQIEVALKENNFELAESALRLLDRLSDDYDFDHTAMILRLRISAAKASGASMDSGAAFKRLTDRMSA